MINSGILLINKEKGISSQKVDSKIKHITGFSKVGHLGTLDPLADGLLVVLINDATKCAKYLEEGNKRYLLRIRLGATSESLDNEKELINRVDTDLRGKEDLIDKLLNDFPRKYNQIPPLYSAIKVNGKPLYDYAIKNKDVEIKSREVSIYSLKRTSSIEYRDESSFFDIDMKVSKGFYVRSFAKDFGDLLNLPAMADSIKRIEVEPFNLSNSYTISQVESGEYSLLNPIDYFDISRVRLSSTLLKKIKNGATLPKSLFGGENLYIVNINGIDEAIYKYDEENSIYRMDFLINNESRIH